jgi:hypothetical protein
VRRTSVVAPVVGALLLASCAHPVGPARTERAYEGKARTTAESAVSKVQTARLAATAGADGMALGPYVSRVLSDAEESLGGLAGTFGSVQPPGAAADEVRRRLDTLLQASLDHVTELRVRARRGDLRGLRGGADELRRDAAAIERFSGGLR